MSKLFYCPYCYSVFNDGFETNNYCFNCNKKVRPVCANYEWEYYEEKIFSGEKLVDILKKESPMQNQENSNIPKCPTCGSTNVKKLSDIKKATHALTFGLFSATARSQFECLNCHYKW